MFKIKICGITRPQDATATITAGADAIGLNFYPRSKRYLSQSDAEKIVADLPPDLVRVGVFVNEATESLLNCCQSLKLDWIQLHGDETPRQLAELIDCLDKPVIRALRMDASGTAPLARYLVECRNLGKLPEAVLVDAFSDHEYGGTGEKTDWNALGADRQWLCHCQFILAGGLTPANVSEAISQARPDAVDVASGVESTPGMKDQVKVAEFVRQARDAFKQSQ